MPAPFTILYAGQPFTITLETGTYPTGNLAVQLFADDELFLTLSVNVPGIPLAVGEFIAKTYSENEGVLEQLVAACLVEYTGQYVPVGRAPMQPVCRLRFPA